MKLTIRILVLFFSSFLLLGSICQERKISTKEARGLWVTRWEWAIHSDSNQSLVQQEKIIEIFDKAQSAKLNFILFQVRGSGDAFYKSKYEPWSQLLTGRLGRNPKWDPLAFAIEQAHDRGLELHAWINTFPVWKGKTPPPHTNPEHVYHAHPEWMICDKNQKRMKLSSHYVNLSPGIPEVREYVHNIAIDIIKNYDVDGLHFDYIRYPERANQLGYSQDPVSLSLFNSIEGNPDDLNWAEWQRENINQFVRKFYDDATGLKPWIKISAAVLGKYDYSKWNGFHIVYQDGYKWLSERKIDFIVPMIYWQTDHNTAPFGQIVKNWHNNLLYKRYIFPGMSINKLGSSAWPVDQVEQQVAITRETGNGMVFFSYTGLEKAKNQLQYRGFKYLANLPPMNWKDETPPMDPRNLKARIYNSSQVVLVWSAPDSSMDPIDIQRYNVFRSDYTPVDFSDAQNLIHITHRADTFFIDKTAKPGITYYYVVTALDRVNNESPPSNEVCVSMPRYTNNEIISVTKNAD